MFEMFENNLNILSNYLLFYILMTMYTVSRIFWRIAKQQDIYCKIVESENKSENNYQKVGNTNFNKFGVTLNRWGFF